MAWEQKGAEMLQQLLGEFWGEIHIQNVVESQFWPLESFSLVAVAKYLASTWLASRTVSAWWAESSVGVHMILKKCIFKIKMNENEKYMKNIKVHHLYYIYMY